jgi:hypothetical protein
MSTIKSITEAVFYKHDDGAETIYVKEPGDKELQLADMARGFDLHAELLKQKLWGDIHRAAKTNPALKQALDEVVLIYTLSK